MIQGLSSALLSQYSSAIDMLRDAISICPDNVWFRADRNPLYWYTAYHALFWLDLYLSGKVDGFAPPAPFTLDELDPAGIIPEKPFSKEEMTDYALVIREKCGRLFPNADEAQFMRPCEVGWGTVSYFELLLDNLRHVQHHVGQLNTLLRMEADTAARWISKRHPK
jgi:hypothetical protein